MGRGGAEFLLLHFPWTALAAAPQAEAESSWAAEDEQEQGLKWEHRTGLRKGELMQGWKILPRLLNTKAKKMPQEDPECKLVCEQQVCKRAEGAPMSSFSRGICSGCFAREEKELVGLWIWFQVILRWDKQLPVDVAGSLESIAVTLCALTSEEHQLCPRQTFWVLSRKSWKLWGQEQPLLPKAHLPLTHRPLGLDPGLTPNEKHHWSWGYESLMPIHPDVMRMLLLRCAGVTKFTGIKPR